MIERKEYLDFLIKLKDKSIIKVVTGIRRCGKSTLFALFKEYLLKNQVSKEQIISLNFENPKDNIFKTWEELYEYIDNRLVKDKMNYIFLDEIQIIKNFEKVVDGLYIQENVDIYITGSNSYMLSGELATYLTGPFLIRNPYFTIYFVKSLVLNLNQNFIFKPFNLDYEIEAYNYYLNYNYGKIK